MLKKRASRIIKGLLAGVLTFSGITVVNTDEVKAVSTVEREDDYTQYVNCFVGTQGDHGILFPGSVVPEGIVKLSPDTTHRSRVGYEYTADEILGFSHTRIEGVGGGGAGGDVLVTPTYMNYTKRPDKKSYEQKFYKVDGKKVEEAHPGYYRTEIVPNTGTDGAYTSDASMGNIEAKVTTDVRTGLHNYKFPEAGNVNLVVDLNNNYHGRRGASLTVNETEDGNVALAGSFKGRSVCDGTYIMYYYMEVDKPVSKVSTWTDGSSALGTQKELNGNDIGAVLNFDVKAGETIQAKVSISPISAEQAKIDMHNEMPHWDYDKARNHAKDLWNDVLGRVRIESSETSDPDGRLKKLFYTNLYHMFTTPVNATSTDGKWRGNDQQLYEADGYTHYDSWTFWDDYRKYAIIGLINPDFYHDVAQSTIDMMVTGYSDTGKENQPVLTVRNEYAVTVIADAVNKGFTDLKNLDKAYEVAKGVAEKHMNQRDGLKYGFIDTKIHDTVTACFEYWGVANLARALGKDVEAKEFAQKALWYKNMFRYDAPTAKYFDGQQIPILWPKHTPNVDNGAWLNCTPDKWQDCGMGQGTLWQYMWYDGYDLGGYIDMMGGKENALKVLSFIFGEQDPDNGYAMLHSNVNEIDPQLPYVFNYAGKPSKTQYWARQIYSKKSWNRYRGDGEFNPPIYDYVYKLTPDGYLTSMDDDCGTMSSMYVAAAMGLFPLTPGDTNIQIGSPFFEKMTLEMGNDKTFTIEAKNVSPDNFYIQSAKLNGKEFNRSWIDYSEVAEGGVLSFEMGSEASTWAEDGEDSFSLSDYVEFEPNIEKPEPDFTKFEAELSDEWSGNGLKNEAINLGGTYNGAWVKYSKVDFSKITADTLNVRYAGNTDNCATDAYVEMHLDSPDGALVGTTKIPPQAQGWGNYGEASEKLAHPELLKGTHDVYFVLKGTTDSKYKYIANVDYMQLTDSPKQVHLEAEEFDETDGVAKEGWHTGNTNNGEYTKFSQVDFADMTLEELRVRYAGNKGNCAPDARIEVRIDNRETGELVAKMDTPPTGDWNSYVSVTSELLKPELLKGKHDVYVTFFGSSGSWVANYDWFEFGIKEEIVDPEPEPEPVDKTELQKLYDDHHALLEVGDRYELVGFMEFEHAMYNAKMVLADEESTQVEVDRAIEVLKEKIAGLKEVGEGVEPADYSKVDEAIAKAEALNKDLYKDFSNVTTAIEAVVRDLNITEQTRVDAMAKAIEDAIDALVYKDADYSKVNEAIAKVPADLSKYTEESVKALNGAVDAVVRDLDITKQKEVDAMAKAIEEALAGLVEWIEWLPIGPSEPVIPWTPLEPSKPIVPTTPLEPSTPVDGDKEEGTDTGDTSNAAGMAGLMALAGAFIVSKKRRKATK